MSKNHPECPLYNHLNCKEYFNPKLCAFANQDKICLKKTKSKPPKPAHLPTHDQAMSSKNTGKK
jgi:hypothetical protein